MKQISYWFSPPPGSRNAVAVHGFGIQERMQPTVVHRPDGTNDFLFMFFYDEVEIDVAGSVRMYPPGSLIIWSPGSMHYYGNPERAWKHSWIHCDGKAIRSMLRANRIPRNKVIADADPAVVEKYLLNIHDELLGHVAPDVQIVENHFHNWVREIRRAMQASGENTTVPPKYLDVKRYIEGNYRERITLADLAAMVHVSVPHFCSEFKKHFDVSAIDYVVRLRLGQAAYLLRDRNLRVSEVAAAVGYEDIYYFSRLFKKHYGTSPQNSRRRQKPKA